VGRIENGLRPRKSLFRARALVSTPDGIRHVPKARCSVVMLPVQAAKREPPAILTLAFRPFFLAASLWSALALALWIVLFITGRALPSRFQSAQLAYSRDAIRVRLGGDRWLHADGHPELDRPHAQSVARPWAGSPCCGCSAGSRA